MKNLFSWLFGKSNKTKHAIHKTPEGFTTSGSPCCNDLVHIAYRGVSDDRLYLVYDKKWQEVKYFRPHGLRVFCRKCRQRIY